MPRDKRRPGPRPFGSAPRRHPYAIPARPANFEEIRHGAKVRLDLRDQARVFASGATLIRGGRMVLLKGAVS
ncbi:hypothetical protein ACMAUO_06080 [Gluconacetobacter sp. Hr-1-5]|uniref:hypothetical protein n=1 Tax=Gluconacetobacter sp. Hr-1-5 TaxID=3395370 RepID=UPI003B52FAE8